MTGIVTAVNAGRLDVEFAPPARCKGCDGACLWYRVPEQHRATFPVAPGLGLGATVTVALPDRYLLLGTLLVYGVPLGALLGGAVLGAAALGSDLGAALGAALGLAAALAAAPLLRRRLERLTLQALVVQPVQS